MSQTMTSQRGSMTEAKSYKNYIGGRWVEPAQSVCIACTPVRQIECQWNEVGFDYFRGSKWSEATVRAFAPRAIAHTRLCSPGSALTLIGRRTGDALCLETTHSRGGVEHRAAARCAPARR